MCYIKVNTHTRTEMRGLDNGQQLWRLIEMKISELLNASLVKIGLESEEKSELFEEMVQVLVSAGEIKNNKEAVQVLEEREAKMSTGIAPGLGLPHGKLPGAKKSIIGIGISKKGIEYDSLDGEPVYVVIVLFAQPDNPGQHIEILAEISRLFSIDGFMEKMKSAENGEQVIKLIQAEE